MAAVETNEKKFGQTLDEAEEIAREYVAKKFGSQDLQIITSTYSASYGLWTISMGKKAEHRREVPASGKEETSHHDELHASGQEETQHEVQADGHEETHQSKVHSYPCDVYVDKIGNVVACTRVVRTAREAEAIAMEYAVKRHGLTHFLPYTTTFDGNYYTVYGGGLVLEEGLVRTALKIYKSKFYDVKVDKSGLIVGWTTEGLISHYAAKLQKIR